MNLEWTMRGLAVMNDDAEEEGEGREGVNDPRTNRKPNAFKDNISVRRSAERASEQAGRSNGAQFEFAVHPAG